ncbi:MAG: zf-HC2 domain-containing protein [Planctomycetota bacterium]
MNCEEVQNLLDAYLDGETTQEQVESILGHLERCEDCNREYQSRAEQSAELRTALSPDPEMLARIQSGVFNSLREDETAGSRAENTIETPQLTMPLPVRGQKRSQINWGRIALAMAAGFLLAALLFQPWNHPPR